MGISYRPDNPFAPSKRAYHPQNPFAPPSREDIQGLLPAAESTGVRRPPRPSRTPRVSVPEDDGSPTVQHVAETIVSGLPGAQRAVAGYRGLLSLLTGNGLQGASDEVSNAMTEQRRHVAQMPTAARLPLQIVGGAPLAAAVAPLGVVGGGTAFGAAAGADQDANSLTERLKNTAKGAAVGAVTAKGGQLAGKGIANVSNRIGLTDVLAKGASKVSDKLASTMGTRGQVNKVLSERQDILDAIGGTGETPAQTQLTRIAQTKAKAGTLYGAARRDTRVLTDPELQRLLEDPQIQKAYQAASEIRSASGNPLSRAAAPPNVPAALQGTISPEQYAKLTSPAMLKARGISNTGTDVLAPELSGVPRGGVEMPDPDVLAKVKRYLWQAANGKAESPLAIDQDQARALLPKVDAIRQKLHTLSPAWKEADAFYARAKGEEEAFAHGFDAFRLSKNPSGEQLPTHSPEAMLQAIEEPRYPGEPSEAMAARANAFRAGVRAAASAQVRGAPVEKGLSSVLNTNALAPTEAAAQVRRLMSGSPTQANTLEDLLASARGKDMATRGVSANGATMAKSSILRSLFRGISQAPDKLATPRGQLLLSQRLRDPSLLSQEIAPQRATYQPFVEQVSGPQSVSRLFRSMPRLGTPTYAANDFLNRLLSISTAGQGAR